MAKKKSQRGRSATARRKKGQGEGGSLLIPIVVGVVFIAIAAALIVSIENSADSPGSVVDNPTAQAQATRQIPNPGVPRISVDETRQKLEAGQLLLVDVRSKGAYDQAHIAGAISIPEEEMAERLDELPREEEIVLYCT
jgi:hypothetical protein